MHPRNVILSTTFFSLESVHIGTPNTSHDFRGFQTPPPSVHVFSYPFNLNNHILADTSSPPWRVTYYVNDL